MAAITQRLHRLRPAHGHLTYPLRHFSSSQATPPSYPKSDEIGNVEATKTTRFVKMYNYSELGAKLQMLRPEKKKTGNSFSLHEFKERLAKLRLIDEEKEEKEEEIGGFSGFTDLRETLTKLTRNNDHREPSRLPFDVVLRQLGLLPPNNMSSAERRKLKLKKIIDECKMPESDCATSCTEKDEKIT